MAINLDISKGDYDLISYPAGESQVRLKQHVIEGLEFRKTANLDIDLIARIYSAQDIIQLALLKSAIDAVSDKLRVNLWLPYLPYSRADRRFTSGDCFGLKVFSNLINSMGFVQVITLDVHSAISQMEIDNLVNIDPSPQINRAIVDFAVQFNSQNVNVLFPDEGAAKRYKIQKDLSCNVRRVETQTFHATKKRDQNTGKFLEFNVPSMPNSDPVLIVDDLCDGGGTFLGISPHLLGKRGLYVSHGIFSKGMNELQSVFDKIYTTDSFYRGQFDKQTTNLVTYKFFTGIIE